MAISMPRSDVMSLVPFADQTFEIYERQEQSRSSAGTTRVKSFGTPLWRMSATTVALHNDDAIDFEAVLRSLDGSVHGFLAGDLRRPFPRQHELGDFSDSAVAVLSVGDNDKSLALKGLPAGLVLSRGDYISAELNGVHWLHQVMEPATANGSGVTPTFEVRPHLPGWLTANAPIKLKQAVGMFMIEPGSIASQRSGALHSVVTFRAMQQL